MQQQQKTYPTMQRKVNYMDHTSLDSIKNQILRDYST